MWTEMTKRQQNALLAEHIMKWSRVGSKNRNFDTFMDDSGEVRIINEPAAMNCFMPTDNLHDAWKLVDKCELENFVLSKTINRKWRCHIMPGKYAEAGSPTEAICLAVLERINKNLLE